MSGYYKSKMSNNAVLAYENGAMPISKWSKQAVLDELPDDVREIAKKYSADAVRYYFLAYDSYHHTGKYFNCTDFFSIDEYAIHNFDEAELAKFDEQFKDPKVEKKSKPTLAYCTWGEWGGTRSHPRLVNHSGYCVLQGNWAYTEELTKKKINGNHFDVISSFNRAPRGTAVVFKEIKQHFAQLS